METKRVKMFKDTAGVWHPASTRPRKAYRTGLVKVTVTIVWESKKAQNTWWVQRTSIPSLSDLNTIAHDFDSAYQGSFLGNSSITVGLESTVALDWSAAHGNFYTLTHTPPLAGSLTGDMNKFDDAVTLKQFSQVSTRGGTGQKRLCGGLDTDFENGVLTLTAIGNWEAAMNSFMTDIITTKGYNLVNVHFFQDNLALDPPEVYSVTTYEIDQFVHHQSSRAAYRTT